MTAISRATRLFFDASVLIAGARSPTGGSALLLEACRRGGFHAVVSHAVLVEVQRNLRRDAPPEAHERFRYDLATISWDLVPTPADDAIQAYARWIASKDAHVLAAALAAPCEFLLTLDRRDFLTSAVQQAGLPITILTPGDFIQHYYPLHPDYPSLPLARGP